MAPSSLSWLLQQLQVSPLAAVKQSAFLEHSLQKLLFLGDARKGQWLGRGPPCEWTPENCTDPEGSSGEDPGATRGLNLAHGSKFFSRRRRVLTNGAMNDGTSDRPLH